MIPALYPENRSEASDGNSSTSALSASATFTGDWVQSDLPEMLVVCDTDADGVLFVDYSVDGTNAITFPVAGYTLVANRTEFHVISKGPLFMRVRLVNGSDAQTFLRLNVYFGHFQQSLVPLNQAVTLDADAAMVRPTSTQDEISTGRRRGVTPFNKFAFRSGLTAAAGYQQVWTNSGNTFTPMSSASTYTIAYNSSTDGAGGGATGAEQLAITHVNSDGKLETFVHTLGSTGSDVTTASGFGINRVAVSASGTNQANVNDITVTETTGGTTQAFVSAGDSVTNQAIFVVPADSTGVSKWLWINVGKPSGGGSPKVNIRGRVYNRNVDTFYNIFAAIVDTASETTLPIEDPVAFNLSPTDVLFFEADTDTNSTDIHVRFSLNVYENL